MTNLKEIRAVLDTNVIIAALKSRNPNSPTAEILRRWLAREFTLLYSDDLSAEYEEKLIAKEIPLDRTTAFLDLLANYGEIISPTADQVRSVVHADPDDDVVLACALVGRATHLVTYDPHLLNLGEWFDGVRIMNGLHFLYAVRGDSPLV